MESLRSLAFHAVGSPGPVSALSFLHATCIQGDVETTKFFLELSPNVVDTIMVLAVPVLSSSTSPYKGKKPKEILDLFDTPSHKSIQELLTFHCKGLEKWPLIHVAARQGNVQHINKLIAQGFNIPVEESKELPMILHLAAEHNSVEVLKELLHLGASLRSKDDRRFSAIHYAAKAGRTENVLYMLDRDMSLRDDFGQVYCTPLHFAAWQGHTETAAALIGRGADVNAGAMGLYYEEIHCYLKCYDDFSGGVNSHNGEYTECKGNITPILLAARQGHLETFELLEQEGGQYFDYPVLFLAVKGGNLALVKKLVNAGLDVKTLDDKGRTLLHFVKSEEAAKFLLDLGLDVMSLDDDGETPLHHAAHIGIKLANVLIENGADVSSKCSAGWTPLVCAVTSGNCTPDLALYFAQKLRQCGKRKISSDLALVFSQYIGPEIARILLDAGFNVNKRGRQRSTPLHSAAQGNPETARLLIENGAKIHAVNRYGETPFQLAARSGKAETLRLLLLKDANLIKAVDWRKRTALYWACAWGKAECVQLLLDHGSNIKAVDNKGNNALHKAVKSGKESFRQVTETLLKHAADVDVGVDSKSSIVNAVNKKGWTALHSAAIYGNASMVQLLLKFGFAIDAIDNKGETPLHLTTDVSTFKLLVESGADVTIADKEGNTVLHVVALSRSTLNIEFLLDQRSADVHSRNARGKTPLHLTAEKLQCKKAEMLLAKGAHVNAMDNDGCTPLHVAAGGFFPPPF